MINPNELRLGNLVYDEDGKVRTVAGIRENGLDVIVLNCERATTFKELVKKVYPIPLTDKRLLKLGFIKAGISYILSGEMGTFVINKWSNGKFMFTSILNTKSFELRTVHQLQNIFFALACEELKIIEDGKSF